MVLSFMGLSGPFKAYEKRERENLAQECFEAEDCSVGLKLGLQLTLISYRQLISFIFYEPSYEFINHAGV